MTDVDKRIEAAKAKLKQLQTQKAALEARKRALESKRTRAEDTRRKILLGGAILAKVQRGEWPESRVRELLDRELTRPDDRALFGLPKLESAPTHAADQPIRPAESEGSDSSGLTPVGYPSGV